MITGAYTLLMTPFNKDLSLDEEGLRTLVRKQVKAGIHGLAPLGVTGESPALSEDEIRRVVEITVEEAGGACKVAPDTCSCNIDQTIAGPTFTPTWAAIMPSSSPLSWSSRPRPGLVEFYRRVADSSRIPVILHNVPDRAGVNIEPKTYEKLIRHGNIIATKDGKKELDHLAKILYLARGTSFAVLTGKDTTAYPLMAFGGQRRFRRRRQYRSRRHAGARGSLPEGRVRKGPGDPFCLLRAVRGPADGDQSHGRQRGADSHGAAGRAAAAAADAG